MRGVAGSTPGHGTTARYKTGCRCDDCRAAKRRYDVGRELRLARGVEFSVDNTGTIRRVQALMALGHTASTIAAASPHLTAEWVQRLIRREGCRVYRTTAQTIDEVYQRLCMTPGTSKLTRRRALAKGWLPPLAWDDIDLDPAPATITALPDAVDEVAVERACSGRPVALAAAECVEVVRRLAARGESDSAIADVLHCRKAAVTALRTEHGIPTTYEARSA